MLPDHKTPRARFAPSPSGRMHLGNLFTALLAWLSVRAAGKELRIAHSTFLHWAHGNIC